MHAVDMAFQSRDLRDKNGTFLYDDILSRLVNVYAFSLQLNCQINEERAITRRKGYFHHNYSIHQLFKKTLPQIILLHVVFLLLCTLHRVLKLILRLKVSFWLFKNVKCYQISQCMPQICHFKIVTYGIKVGLFVPQFSATFGRCVMCILSACS